MILKYIFWDKEWERIIKNWGGESQKNNKRKGTKDESKEIKIDVWGCTIWKTLVRCMGN